jgi:DNA-binding NtrC family response regulator
MNVVRKVAKTDANILITGENGSGKEIIAREIHRLSSRHNEVIVNVDMGAISETLFESELFGHTKGAFTDAHESRAGKFETANRGTLFLDEIGNLSYNLQAKLLAAIQNREFMRLGSNKALPLDIRLICATNKNLEKMVAEGLFREDLLYRINTIHIEVPPLRERGNDIIILSDFFLKKYSSKYEKHGLKINRAAQEKLLKYAWPGNIRELQHTIEKAVILSDSSILKPGDFFFKAILSASIDDEHLTIEEMEKRMIITSLEKNAGNMSQAAEKLGITRQTMYNKIKKYGL